MKNLLARTCLAAFLLSASAGAHAVPITFEFTGTITGYLDGVVAGSELGMSVTGGLRFDSERMSGGLNEQPDGTPASFFNAEPFTSSGFMSFGERRIEWPLLPSDAASIFFLDGCSSASCAQADAFYMRMYTADFSPSPFPQPFEYMNIGVMTTTPGELASTFDAATVDPTAVATLPIYSSEGVFLEAVIECSNFLCTNANSTGFLFNIDSVTRSDGTVAVPEPGTLALLVAGLLGLVLGIRRRTT